MRRENKATSPMKQRFSDLGICALSGLATSLITALIISAVIYSGALPPTAAETGAFVCAFLGGSVCSLMYARKRGEKYLLSALIAAGVYFIVMLIMGAIFFGHVLPNGGVGKMILCLLAAGATGGVLAANVKKRRR